jgi:hypothetical protein
MFILDTIIIILIQTFVSLVILGSFLILPTFTIITIVGFLNKGRKKIRRPI